MLHEAGKNKRKKGTRLERDRLELLDELKANRRRRDKTTARIAHERSQLVKLLVKGVAVGATVGELAEQAGISRPHAHRLLSKAAVPAATETDSVSAAETGDPTVSTDASAVVAELAIAGSHA